MDGGEADPGGEDDEGEGVDERGQDAGALVAEGLLVGGWAGLEVDCGEGEQDGEQVADVVASLGDEREGVGAEELLSQTRAAAQRASGAEVSSGIVSASPPALGRP